MQDVSFCETITVKNTDIYFFVSFPCFLTATSYILVLLKVREGVEIVEDTLSAVLSTSLSGFVGPENVCQYCFF